MDIGGKGKEYHLSHNIQAARRILSGKGAEISREKKIKIEKKGGGKNITLLGTLHTPSFID